jgi:hypothetical protein
MSEDPWAASGSFHIWFVEQIEKIVGENPPIIRVSSRQRPLEEDDFGYDAKTFSNWLKSPPKGFPGGRKLLDIISSDGFKHLLKEHQYAIIVHWIRIELGSPSHELTDEVVGTLLNMVEKSSRDFLAECVDEALG